MKKVSAWTTLSFAGILVVFGASPGAAKVVFTGYGDMRVIPQSVAHVSGSDALLNSFGVTDRRIESRTFTIDSLGLFATTSLDEQTDFLMDVSYKKIGTTTGETRVQYAYLDYHPAFMQVEAGRITLPIGYYNRHYFYPFQRAAITSPVYQSTILGLPIADQGALVSKRVPVGPVGLTGIAFVVNGYGPSTTSTDTFRAGLGVTNSLIIANNVSHTNTNSKFAYGGNVRADFFSDSTKLGVSSYRSAWNASGKDFFTMLNAYFVVEANRFNLIAEALQTKTDNDQGVVGFFGTRDWKSSGGFLEASYAVIKKESKELALFAGTESTVSKGDGTGAEGREKLNNTKAGVAWKINPSMTLKSEFDWLSYHLPIVFGASTEELGLKSNQIQFSLSVTY